MSAMCMQAPSRSLHDHDNTAGCDRPQAIVGCQPVCPKTCVDKSALAPRGQLTAAARREPEEMHATFEGISMQFGAISALAGIPQV